MATGVIIGLVHDDAPGRGASCGTETMINWSGDAKREDNGGRQRYSRR